MADDRESPSEELLERVCRGEAGAEDALFERYRARLRRVVALRLDRRLAARLDPSDVVQEALAEAHRQLEDYRAEQPLPFYLWLRGITLNRLVDAHRRHLLAQKRSVLHEARAVPAPNDESVLELAERLLQPGTSPSGAACQEEQRQRLQALLMQLGERDREVLVLRHLEGLSLAEIAAVLCIREGAVKVRHFRALERLRALLAEGGKELLP